MIKKIIISIIIIQSFAITCIIAQDSIDYKSKNLFIISTGYSKHIIRDDVISPLIYKGANAPLLLNYRYIGNKSRQSLTLSYDNLELKTSNTNNASSYALNTNTFLDYNYNRKIYTFNKLDVNCFLGGNFLAFVNYRDYHFSNATISYFSGELMTSLGINLFLEKNLKGKKDGYLYFNINMPLVAYVILNDRYNTNVSETIDEIDLNKDNYIQQVLAKGNVVTLNKLFEFQTELSYSLFLSKHVGFEIKHKFHFYSFSQYENLLRAKYVNNQFLIGLIIKI